MLIMQVTGLDIMEVKALVLIGVLAFACVAQASVEVIENDGQPMPPPAKYC